MADGEDGGTAPVVPDTTDEPTPSEPESPDDPLVGDDGPVIIEDFHPGEEDLVLSLEDGLSEDASVSVEPSGETGEDASVVVDDGQNRLVAAIIRGGFGAVSSAHIHLISGQ